LGKFLCNSYVINCMRCKLQAQSYWQCIHIHIYIYICILMYRHTCKHW
jgi:hypothetical protein